MKGRHLLFPLIVLSGVGGGFSLVATTFLTSNSVILLLPYLFILSGICVYLRLQSQLVMNIKYELLTIVSVYVIMSAVLYTYVTVTGFDLYMPPARLVLAVLFLIAAGFAGILALHLLPARKRDLSLGEK